MPKFYCTHCGQHIDAPDDLAGSHASCPSCGGEIFIPAIPGHRITAPVSNMTLPNVHKKRASFLKSKPFKATMQAIPFCLIWAFIGVRDPFQEVGLFIGTTFGALLFSSLFAFLIALLIAGIMSKFNRNFVDSLTRGYSIGVLAIPGIVAIGNLIS